MTNDQALKLAIYEIRKVEDEYSRDGSLVDHLTGAKKAREAVEKVLEGARIPESIAIGKHWGSPDSDVTTFKPTEKNR